MDQYLVTPSAETWTYTDSDHDCESNGHFVSLDRALAAERHVGKLVA